MTVHLLLPIHLAAHVTVHGHLLLPIHLAIHLPFAHLPIHTSVCAL